MASKSKTLEAVLSGRSDANVRFSAIRSLVISMGFSERIKGDHFIYSRGDIAEIINIQPASGGKAKPYQVKQIRGIITKYGLGAGE
jgi:hypothetical protein